MTTMYRIHCDPTQRKTHFIQEYTQANKNVCYKIGQVLFTGTLAECNEYIKTLSIDEEVVGIYYKYT